MDREPARVHVTDRVDEAYHPAGAAHVQARERLAIGGEVEERVTGQHLLAVGAQPVVQLVLLPGPGVQLVADVRPARGPQPGQPSWAP